jgi:hypothetical protein
MSNILLFLSYSFILFAQDKETRVLEEIFSHKELIIKSSEQLGVSPRVVASIIYAERFLNYNWEDDLLDELFAETGYNSSIGFGQMKPNTAFFIEQQLHNPSSKYFLGNNIQIVIKQSKSKKEIIEKLVNDTTNIYYCSAYLAMIKHRWSDTFLFQSANEAVILATLYSLGIIKYDGTERVPHDNPQINYFGKTAQDFFDSFKLTNTFN